MPLSDYAHWNEDAEYMWWHEEGKHDTNEPPEPDDESWRDEPRPEEYTEGTHLPTQEEAARLIYNNLGPFNTTRLKVGPDGYHITVEEELNGGFVELTIQVTVEGWAE